MSAGGVAAMVGNPAEVALIRMAADGAYARVWGACSSCRAKPENRRGYKNVFDALVRIIREEKITTLWRVRLDPCCDCLV
jgi:solute carrier family 25 oxoglutarate transporter 11